MMKSVQPALLAAALLCTPALAQEAGQVAAETIPTEAQAQAQAETPAETATSEAPTQAQADTVAETPAEAVAAEAPAQAQVDTPDETTSTPAASAPETPAPMEAAAASGAVPAPPEGKGQVVFYRPSSLLGAALTPIIREAGTPVTKLGLGRYYVHILEPGLHTFEVKTEAADTFDLEVDAGETYYVKQTMGMGALVYRANLSPSTEQDFQAKAKKLKPAKPLS